LNKDYIAFEKRHGDKSKIEDAIVGNRRTQYEELISQDCYNYDTWFDYIRLEETEGNMEKTREVYERAVSNVPPLAEKRFWRRYVYLWINYALFEELQVKSVERTRAVWRACLQVIPHRDFTFGKIWLMAAQFEIRQKDLAAARKLLGQALGMCGKENLFRGYIEMEYQMGEIERCRSIYTKYLETMPHNCTAWKAFAQLEINVGETERARSIYEIAVKQSELDMPELLWKAYIDFELSESEAANVRKLYTRLLERTSHVKVWISYAQFEANEPPDEDADGKGEGGCGAGIEAARAVFKQGYSNLKAQGLKEERVLLLEAWIDAERKAPKSRRDIDSVNAMFPKKIKMRRTVVGDDGQEAGIEEYYDYTFPDDEKKVGGMKLLEQAMKWKMAAAAASAGSMKSTTNEDSDSDQEEEGDEDADTAGKSRGRSESESGEDGDTSRSSKKRRQESMGHDIDIDDASKSASSDEDEEDDK